MSTVKLEEVNAFIKKYDLPLDEVTNNDDALTVLFRIVEAQAEAIKRLRENEK